MFDFRHFESLNEGQAGPYFMLQREESSPSAYKKKVGKLNGAEGRADDRNQTYFLYWPFWAKRNYKTFGTPAKSVEET